jgi:hypothetical protein
VRIWLRFWCWLDLQSRLLYIPCDLITKHYCFLRETGTMWGCMCGKVGSSEPGPYGTRHWRWWRILWRG